MDGITNTLRLMDAFLLLTAFFAMSVLLVGSAVATGIVIEDVKRFVKTL